MIPFFTWPWGADPMRRREPDQSPDQYLMTSLYPNQAGYIARVRLEDNLYTHYCDQVRNLTAHVEARR